MKATQAGTRFAELEWDAVVMLFPLRDGVQAQVITQAGEGGKQLALPEVQVEAEPPQVKQKRNLGES